MMKESNPAVFAVAFAAYSLLIVLVGLLSARFAKRSDEDYFLAGRSLGKWIAALSASASSESGWVTLGLVGWAFTQGVKAYWIMPGCLLGFAFNWFVLAGRLSDQSRQLNAITVPDFFSFRFRERVPILRGRPVRRGRQVVRCQLSRYAFCGRVVCDPDFQIPALPQ
jgi:sodium/proline symporter